MRADAIEAAGPALPPADEPNDDDDILDQRWPAMARERHHNYAIRPAVGGPPILTALVDREHQNIRLTDAKGNAWTVDVTTARAAWVVIEDAFYTGLAPDIDGPLLTVEVKRGRPEVIDTAASSTVSDAIPGEAVSPQDEELQCTCCTC